MQQKRASSRRFCIYGSFLLRYLIVFSALEDLQQLPYIFGNDAPEPYSWDIKALSESQLDRSGFLKKFAVFSTFISMFNRFASFSERKNEVKTMEISLDDLGDFSGS